MCGISGIVNRKGFDAVQIKQMTDIVRHRGPDGEGFLLTGRSGDLHLCGGRDTNAEVWVSGHLYSPTSYIESFSGTNAILAMGHRRLSILDLSPGGHQPMSYLSGQYWIVFNGEIYNYRDLKVELEGFGYRFNSRSDTEVVLASFAEWGEKCLERLVGMWAFAIWDKTKNELFLGRDRYGIKPLYYWFSPDGQFNFGSEIKQFTVLNGWTARLNKSKAHDYLIYSFTDHTDETMFDGVYQLPSGSHYRAQIDNIKPDHQGRIEYRKWYYPPDVRYKGSFNDAALEFRKLFERSVSEHLHADVRVGTALSGGLDSSSIVCEVNKLLRNNGQIELQKTFSSCASDSRFDEKKWMDIVVEQTKVDAHFIYPELDEVFKQTGDIIWHQDEPYQSQSVFLGYNVFKLSRQNGVKVLLNGQGADEYLGGYGQFTYARYAGLAKKLRLAAIVNDIRNLKKVRPVAVSDLVRGIGFSLLPSGFTRSLTRIRSTSDNVKKIIDIARLVPQTVHPYDIIPVRFRTVPEISEHYTFYSTLPKYLRWEDRNSMAHSVEARVPFLDHRLVEFAFGLPDDFFEKNGISKRVMREAMKGLLPEKINNRKDKKGFITPEENWVKKENPEIFRSKISEAIDVTRGIIKPEAIEYFDRIVSGKLQFDYTYWRLIMFSEWTQKFSIQL